jgi:phage baseplate assembly protein gpV
MLKYGKISEIGAGDWLGFARVFFDELNIPSYWLQLPSHGNWKPFKINTQVSVLMHPDGEQGIIIGKAWSKTDAPPSWADANTEGIEFSDGTKIYYNTSTNKLIVNAGTDGVIEITGTLKVDGKIMASGEVEANNITFLETDATKVSLSKHTHLAAGTATAIPTIPEA